MACTAKRQYLTDILFDVQRQKEVSVYFTSKQILPFGFAQNCYIENRCCEEWCGRQWTHSASYQSYVPEITDEYLLILELSVEYFIWMDDYMGDCVES